MDDSPLARHFRLAGIVLAGGQSSRMGRDKAELLTADGRSFLDHAITLLQELGCERVIVSGSRPGYDHVPDYRPNQGPLGGIFSVLSNRKDLAHHWLLVIPVDMPGLTSATLSRLADMSQTLHCGAVIDHSPLPMLLAPGPDRLKVARSILDGDGPRSLGSLVEQLGLVRTPVSPDDRLGNINRPGDYRAD